MNDDAASKGVDADIAQLVAGVALYRNLGVVSGVWDTYTERHVSLRFLRDEGCFEEHGYDAPQYGANTNEWRKRYTEAEVHVLLREDPWR